MDDTKKDEVLPSSDLRDQRSAFGPDLDAGKVSSRSKLPIWCLIVVLAGSCSVYLLILAPDKFGVQYDDGIYVATAKSLATGQGYRIISLPYEPEQTKYPPFYPSLLSLIWRVRPQFPENLTSMMLLSVFATLSFLGMTWRYLVEQGYAGRWTALVVIGLTAINERLIILATSVVSEMPYAALSVLSLYLAEKYERERRGRIWGALAGTVMGMAFLTRSAGIALLISVAVYFLLRRQWRKGILPVAIGAAVVVGWLGWSYINRSTIEGVNVAYYTSYLRDFNEVIEGLQAAGSESRLSILTSIVMRNIVGFVLVSVPICLGLPYELIPYFGFAFLFIAAGFVRLYAKGFRLLQIYVVSYLVFHLIWPYITYSRFLMPLLPFLLLFIVTEFELFLTLARREWSSSGQLVRKISALFIGLAAVFSISAVLYYSGQNISQSLATATVNKTPGPSGADREAIEWIKAHTDSSDVVLCSSDPLYYLYTGRKAARSFAVNLSEAALLVKAKPETINEQTQSILRIIHESNARYIVLTAADFGYDSDTELSGLQALIEDPRMFIRVFTASDQRSMIYRIETVSSDGQ